ncbi:hypothetical protein LTS18_008857, partial [Coniosporium uncinatum]
PTALPSQSALTARLAHRMSRSRCITAVSSRTLCTWATAWRSWTSIISRRALLRRRLLRTCHRARMSCRRAPTWCTSSSMVCLLWGSSSRSLL